MLVTYLCAVSANITKTLLCSFLAMYQILIPIFECIQRRGIIQVLVPHIISKSLAIAISADSTINKAISEKLKRDIFPYLLVCIIHILGLTLVN